MVSQAFCIGEATPALARTRQAEARPAHRSRRWLTMLILAGCCGSAWFGPFSASAQGRGLPLVVAVAPQLWLKPGVETPIEIRLVPNEAVPPQSVLVIRGVPPGLRFSEGRLFGSGVWVLPAARLPDLKLQAPGDIISGGLLIISLTTLEGVAIAQAQVTVLSVPETCLLYTSDAADE